MEGESLKSSDTAAAEPLEFTCNICGRRNRRPLADFAREQASCDGCNSSVRARAIIHMLSRELFGADLTLPDFPRVKALRGIGLSDFCYDERLARKVDYKNSFYHKEPRFDVMNLDHQQVGLYDFLISSEVFEHVAPPAETAFNNACRALKPNGVLFLTVPYTLGDRTKEHFPDLHDYGLAQLRNGTVLVNRTRTGEVQVFDDLCFHGGDGSTLETRVYTEKDLRALITGAGFESLRIYGENYLPFGIVRTENWSLPMAARKQPFKLSLDAAGEFTEQWQVLRRRARHFAHSYRELKAKFTEFHAWANETISTTERDLASRTEWARKMEAELEERTKWALNLEQQVQQGIDVAEKLKGEFHERTEWALSLQADVAKLEAELNRINSQKWVRAGRKFGLLE